MEMVTRVAMAIASSQLDEGDSLYDWYALTEEVQDDFLATARAAIEAMREPTLQMKMVNQGVFMNAAKGYTIEGSDWHKIIDAALSPSGEK